MSKSIIAVVIILLVGVGAFYYFKTPVQAPENGKNLVPEKQAMPGENMMEKDKGAMMEKEAIVTITNDGFSPAKLTVPTGTKVTFKNMGDVKSWPASAMHPTHTVYPGSDTKKCGTSEQPDIFDACRGLAAGESWSFIFTHEGIWKYHDHLHSTVFGQIVVE